MDLARPQWVDQVASTNTALLDRLRSGEALPSGYVLAARQQTAGRGRGQNQWATAPNRDLCCSLVLRIPAGGEKLLSLSMAVALSTAMALDRLGLRAHTKWPNDVVVAGHKIAGILPELASSPATAAPEHTLVVGIGVNVNMDASAAASIGSPATSVLLETGAEASVEEVLDHLLADLATRIRQWEAGGFAALRPDWTARCLWLEEKVAIDDGERRVTGILKAFGDSGQLLLGSDDGPVRQVWTGTLRLAAPERTA